MEQEGTQEPARFDPRIAEPPAVPTLIPVLRPAGAEDAAAAGDLDPEDPGLLDLDPAESAHPAAVAVEPTEPLPPVVRPPPPIRPRRRSRSQRNRPSRRRRRCRSRPRTRP